MRYKACVLVLVSFPELEMCSTGSLESILCPCIWITTNTNEKRKRERNILKMFNLRTPPSPVMPVHMMVVMASMSAGGSKYYNSLIVLQMLLHPGITAFLVTTSCAMIA